MKQNMNPMKSKQLNLFAAAFAVVLLTACGRDEATGEKAARAAAELADTAPGWLLDEAPPSALGVIEAMDGSAPGESFVATGRVGGVMQPITEGMAAFILTDERVHFCDEAADDHCPTPWDACCESPDLLKSSRVFVQINGSDHQPLAVDLRTEAGLRENMTVVVRGRMADDVAPGERVIYAEALYVAKE
jgi:hypothetical protein